MDKRINFISQALEINKVQAELLNMQMKDIPDNELKNFFVFRMNYIEPNMSKELITKNALFDFRKKQILNSIANGSFEFKDIEQLKKFCTTYFKNKDLCNGASNYFDYVVIGMNKDGDLINKFKTNESGHFLKIGSEKESEVYTWLFHNQKRLGVVNIIPYYDTNMKYQLENKSNQIQSDKMLGLLNQTNKAKYNFGGK